MGYNYPGTKIKIKSYIYMIIKRKLYTRQETKAMKEMYQALKKGNIGRGLSAKKFVKARHVSNETIDALTGKDQVVDYAKNSQAINNIGLPETAKAYKRMMEKYTNPELHERFKRIQAASSNNRLRVARQKVKKSGQYVVDPFTNLSLDNKKFYKERKAKGTYDIREIIEDNSKQNRIDLEKLDKIKKERAGKNYRFKRKNIESNYDNEFSELETKYNQAKKLNTTLGYDPESAQKILKDLKKDNIKTAVGSNLTTEYNYKNDTININNIHRKNPYTILHEVGHRVSDNREQLRGGKYYGNYRSLDKKVNTSHNLHNSIMNNVGNLSTLMNEANASYHAAALAKKYNLPREMQKAGNKSLDYSFRTYESNAANKMMTDDTVRLLGKYKNK